ncbi:hypothetical protein Har1130_11355 [Haloarcula sp. CBA1130]|uniref:mechanosensitive ion channel family protein n=1 Tax=unclassified Haloarcula TaxID=2624677 RepID=UPI001248B6F3|nr:MULTISPECIES: hypothetical protein [unclassified Haloarcula]KAA9398800.1 hypothetical protein Har1129_11450 [Haloarcula sp. CBA1129]KAA9403314.1 hypothetical protein Har1130_11355 [Haloarcula sp. CBA1130]
MVEIQAVTERPLLLQANLGDRLVKFLTDLVANGISAAGTVLLAAIVLAIGYGVGKYLDESVYDWTLERGLDDRASETPVAVVTTESDAVASAAGLLTRYFVYLTTVLAAVRVLNIRELQTLVGSLFGYVPNIVAAVVFVVVGFGLGRLFGTLVPGLVSRTTLTTDFPETHFGQLLDADDETVGTVTGLLVEYYIYATALYVAAATLTITPVAGLLYEGLLYTPALIGGLVVLVLGSLVADHVATVVTSVDDIEDWAPRSLVSGALQALVYLFTVVIALNLAGVDSLLLAVLLLAVVFPIGIGFALAVGLGGQDFVAGRLHGE